MSKWGWCLDGKHEDCRRVLIGVQTGDPYECSCECHQDAA